MKALFLLQISALIFIALSFPYLESVDLETRAQEFVLETKRIEIPDHPYAFNPSIVQWRGAYLMSFREMPFPQECYPCSIDSSSFSQIGLIFLFDDFSLDGEAQKLDLPRCMINEIQCTRAEDARLTVVDGRLYITYSDNLEGEVQEGGFRMYVGELDYNGKQFFLRSLEVISHFPGQSPSIREKNWTPFDFEGQLHLSYYIEPHRIFLPYLDGSESAKLLTISTSKISWKWGELRGGTPALRCGQEYLSFFHSWIDVATENSDGEIMSHYFIGAYTFQKEPPFKLTRISREPIIGKNFYQGEIYPYYWKPVRVVFPCGFVFDDQYIWLSYGRQDHEIWIAKMDKSALLSSLIPVTQD